MKMVVRAVIACAALSVAASAAAQKATVVQPPTGSQVQARQQISALEAALESAVRSGAQMLDQRLQSSSAANMVMLAGMARARGFRLDDYGVVFDVEFPSMRRSMVWSMQELERASTGKAVRAADRSPAVDPREIYQTEITNALVNAILDYPGVLGVAADEWLTVAARESVIDRRLVGTDPGDTSITVILRIKGSDLNAVRERRLSREEARARVDVKQY